MPNDNNTTNQTYFHSVVGSVYGKVEQHFEAPNTADNADSQAAAPTASPVYLSKRKGNKIDLIRIANSIYELGMVEDAHGARLTKKDFMVAFGNAFNIDLADYDKDLSNSMASSVAYDKQTRIFDEMKAKHQEIYNSK